MRTLTPYYRTGGSLMGGFAQNMAEAMAVRSASLEAKTARIAAELSIKARSEFLANMNHELRTPLNAIIGFSTMLKEAEAYGLDEEKRRGYAEYILQSADLLLDHINTLLEAAALDGGEIILTKDAVDLEKLLDAAVARAGIAASARKVSIEVKAASDPVKGFGDEERISQALDHIIKTAIRLSPESGKIFVRARCDDGSGWGEIAIRDRSEGLSPQAIAKALTVFNEVHRGLDRSFEGPGIGLAIAKTFIEMQGGRFSIKSRSGEGNLVRIYLPPLKEAAKPKQFEEEIIAEEPAQQADDIRMAS